ncbi:hypothetical protein [Methylobacterium brachythecii]|uniref:Extradiol ring-cleavage dioxygenase LigAB LigA subunit domain-containing protein n=1 Tax=Methylobacterium brachythecii TaxID=1176177 RepID=A0A7W6AQM1_9HYPH|nr:hypothetical protein [Methylobacterium brachythecii]MBB3904067.1 hypothetical protein [Methylobacterium brachythecii]GLS42808.1 hypothetical protein GCM10007884_07930 [Methylobacterium brachythecii]
MSAYQVEKLCRRVLHDSAFRARMQSEPADALATVPLNLEEREAILAGDVGWLYRHGASAFLLPILSRFEICGLALPVFNRRMRAEIKN